VVYIPNNALGGSRGQRMAVGVILLLAWLVFGVACSAMTVGGRDLPWPARLGFAAEAVSSFLLVWWCCRFWYAAFSEGRRAEPVAEPHSWPWLTPMPPIGIGVGVHGVQELTRGHGSGWIMVGMAVLFLAPSGLLLATTVHERVRPAPPAPAPVRPAEPPRPRRDWGPVGR
jgi:hypothetical protein